jgi:hypothetical protein
MIEAVERRLLFSGAVSAEWSNDTLVLTGDDSANIIRIVRDPAAASGLSVIGESSFGIEGNPINGLYRFPIDRRGFNLRIDLRGGDDRLEIVGAKRLGDVQVLAGPGRDDLQIVKSLVHGRLKIDTQGNNDSASLRESAFFGEITVAGGTGRDRIELARIQAVSNFQFQDFHAATSLAIGTSSFDGRVEVVTGGNADAVFIDSSHFRGGVGISTGAGDDSVILRNGNFVATPQVDAGDGSNHVESPIVLDYSFAEEPLGWQSGYAEVFAQPEDLLPGGTYPSPETRNWFQLQTRLRKLPDQLRAEQKGYWFHFNNRSDNVFAFISKGLSEADGIEPEQRYTLQYDVEFASNVYRGLTGIGGPPDAVAMWIGGSEIQPRPSHIDPDTGTVRLNIDHDGTRGQPSTTTGIGRISNGLAVPVDADGTPTRWRFQSLRGTHRESVKADSKGRLWLVAGARSGFEGITSFYITRVKVTVTPVAG